MTSAVRVAGSEGCGTSMSCHVNSMMGYWSEEIDRLTGDCSWVRGPSQAVAERRQSESASSSTGEARTTGVTEQARKASWGSKHIHGTGAGAAAWRAQYPRSGSRS